MRSRRCWASGTRSTTRARPPWNWSNWPTPQQPFLVAGRDLVRAAAADLAARVAPSTVAARFHNGVADLIADGCLLLRERHGLSTVALSGGVFQNLLLLHATVSRLEAHGFAVLIHSRVPCNDGGISLGQAVVAAAAG